MKETAQETQAAKDKAGIVQKLFISRCNIEEMPIIARLIRSSADWYRSFVAEKDMKEHDVGQEWIDKNFCRREFYLARNPKGEPIGFHSHQTFGKVAYLGYIYLDIAHVGKGYGKKLVDHARRLSEAKQLESMVLLAHPKAKWVEAVKKIY